MPTSDYYHVTTVDNLRNVLDSGGNLSTLRHLANDFPDQELDVELTPLPLQRKITAAKAYRSLLNKLKNSDYVHFTKDGYLPNYGEVVIRKSLGHSVRKRHAANTIPQEYITNRRVSLRNADIYVPADSLEELTNLYGDRYRFIDKAKLNTKPYGLVDRIKALGRKTAYKVGLIEDF